PSPRYRPNRGSPRFFAPLVRDGPAGRFVGTAAKQTPMSISYDPSAVPDFDPQATDEATRLGLTPINVVCDEVGRQPGDQGGVSFTAFVSFVPRIGDRIILQDGTMCEVRRVYHKVAKAPGSTFFTMVANVAAIRVGPAE